MKHMKKLICLLAVTLTLSLLWGTMPAMAWETQASDTVASSSSSSDDIPDTETTWLNEELPQDATELPELREANVKHFRMPDGSYQAVVYGKAVHRQAEDGTWQDIDNRLTETGSEIATPDARVKFVKKTTGNGQLFTLHEHNRKVTVSLDGAEKKVEGQVTNARLSDSEVELQKQLALEAIRGSVLYSDILTGVDLEYILDGNDIKENIIVKEHAETYVYSFTVKLNNLTAVQREDGEILLVDEGSGEIFYRIPKGYMFDSAGAYSEAVSYTLTDGGNGSYTLTVTADAQWINDPNRVFPVTVDPSMVTIDGSAMIDTYIDSTAPSSTHGTDTLLYACSDDESIVLMRFATPSLPSNAIVSSAFLTAHYYYGLSMDGYTVNIGAYRVLQNWEEDTATWNSMSAYTNKGISTTQLDVDTIQGSASYDSKGLAIFDITDAMVLWSNGTANRGIALKCLSGTALTQAFFISSEDSSTYKPSVTISYDLALEDGIYMLQNVGSGRYMSFLTSNSLSEGTYVYQRSMSSPATSFNRLGLFKITRVGDSSQYVVRSMLNNALGIGLAGTNVVTKAFPLDDNDVAATDLISIQYVDTGYMLLPNNTPAYAIGATSSSSTSLTKVNYSTATNLAKWNMAKVDVADQGGYVLDVPDEWSNEIQITTSGSIGIITWSTVPNANIPFISIASDSTASVTNIWNDNNKKLNVTANDIGNLVLDIFIKKDDVIVHSFIKNYTVSLRIKEGTYSLRTDNNSVFMYAYYSRGYALQRQFSGTITYRWELIYDHAQYYKIKNLSENVYLTVPSNFSEIDNFIVCEEWDETKADNQLWKFVQLDNGKYTIQPKSSAGTQLVLASNDFNSYGAVLRQMAHGTTGNYSTVWSLVSFNQLSNLVPEIQQTTLTCWVASSRMTAKHYVSVVTKTQEDAINDLKDGDYTTGGTLADAKQAIEYFIDGNSTVVFVAKDGIYSEANLVRFLNDGHVIYISREIYTDINDPNSYEYGHATVIVGYATIEEEYLFLIYSPSATCQNNLLISSYDSIYNGRTATGDDYFNDNSIWVGCVVAQTSYSDDTILNYMESTFGG